MSHILSDEDCTSLLMELEGAGYGFSNTLHEAERFAHKRKIENNHDANTRQMVATSTSKSTTHLGIEPVTSRLQGVRSNNGTNNPLLEDDTGKFGTYTSFIGPAPFAPPSTSVRREGRAPTTSLDGAAHFTCKNSSRRSGVQLDLAKRAVKINKQVAKEKKAAASILKDFDDDTPTSVSASKSGNKRSRTGKSAARSPRKGSSSPKHVSAFYRAPKGSDRRPTIADASLMTPAAMHANRTGRQQGSRFGKPPKLMSVPPLSPPKPRTAHVGWGTFVDQRSERLTFLAPDEHAAALGYGTPERLHYVR